MRIALCSTIVPFVRGGARNIVDWLEEALVGAGHEVAKVLIPEVDHPGSLFGQMVGLRWLDLSDADRVICFRPQSHLVRHPHKILWFIHHLRTYYDLWDDPELGPPHTLRNIGFRDALHAVDTAALDEATRVFTNSNTVRDRLKRFNGIEADVLYPPVAHPERFHPEEYGDEVVYVSRIERHKRQHLLVQALGHCRTPVRVRLAGECRDDDYRADLHRLAREADAGDRLVIDERWVTEPEKVAALNSCLAAAYLPLDEDSYGYPTLEAAHAAKATISTRDAGGVLEFVVDDACGVVTEPDPAAIAAALDRLYEDRARTRRLGEGAAARLDDLGIGWDRVLSRLLA